MTNIEASEIIKAYKESLAHGTEGGTVLRKASLLPCSKAKIKHAYYTLIEDIIQKESQLTEDQKEDLTSTYSLLNNFIDDRTAKRYAQSYLNWQIKKEDFSRTKKDEGPIKQYLYFIHSLKGEDLAKELNEYIKELLEEKK